MKKVSVYKYYSFSFNYCLLRHFEKGNNKDNLLRRLKGFLKFLEELDLKVTLGIAKDLYRIINDLEKQEDAEISPQAFREVIKCLDNLDPALDSELKLKDLYVITSRNHSIDKLTNNIESMFVKNVFSDLPVLSKYDFQEAGKCIAFNLPTAAAFHLMRAIEENVRFYYKKKIKRNRISNQLWGPLLNHLKTKKKAPIKLLELLDHIRNDYRNPTQHPDAKYNIDEAQDLLPLTISVCNMMYKDLTK